MSKQEEAQKLLNEYVKFYLNWYGRKSGEGDEKAVVRRNSCYDSTAFPLRRCCKEHIDAGAKFRDFKERFQKLFPEGFKPSFPHGYYQRGFYQKFVAAFGLTVDPNEIGLMWNQPGFGSTRTPGQHWNTPDTTPRYD